MVRQWTNGGWFDSGSEEKGERHATPEEKKTDRYGWPVDDRGNLESHHDSRGDALAAEVRAVGMTTDEAEQFAARIRRVPTFVVTVEPAPFGLAVVRVASGSARDLVFRKKDHAARYLNDLGQEPLTLRGHTEPEWGGLGPASWGRG